MVGRYCLPRKTLSFSTPCRFIPALLTVPPNTTATIFVPAKDAAGVTESGGKIGEARAPALSNVEGVKFLRMENNAAVYAVGSGTYQFQSSLAKTAK